MCQGRVHKAHASRLLHVRSVDETHQRLVWARLLHEQGQVFFNGGYIGHWQIKAASCAGRSALAGLQLVGGAFVAVQWS